MTALQLAAPHVTHTSDLDRRLAALLRLVEQCDREVTPLLAARVEIAFDDLVHAFDARVRTLSATEAARLGAQVQATLMPLMRRAGNGYRWYSKPRGYAGDFLSIAQMYDDRALGDDAVARLLDRCFLNFPAARAVQNRRALLTREIRGSRRVTSLACGPARELFDILPNSEIAATLVDFDREALAHCRRESERLGVAVDLVEANLIHVATGRRTLPIADQDLVYSIGLIDYFDDALVVKLLDWVHSTLRPGGRVIVGNFHPDNPTRAVMDHVLEWKLVHRDEDDMNRLLCASAFGKPCSRILYEDQGINLFAEAVK